ncbi:glycosyl transferases group 1 [bacterium BMS3Bbin08]|nr:glycosyl transferases group 1 [bacterium BMS3Bbin08]
MNRIRVFINYKTTDMPWGGSNSFLCALKEFSTNLKDFELISDKHADFDLMLLNTAYTAPGRYISLKQVRRYHEHGYSNLFKYILKRFKKRQIKIVLRLDGLRRFYAEMPEAEGDRIQLSLIRFADAVIFQSDESLNQFKKITGDIPVQHYIIHNGVNQKIFNMEGKRFWNKKDKLKIFTTSWSTNPRKGFGDIVRLSLIDGVTVNFVGNWPKEINHGKVYLKPSMPQNLLSEEYKKNDVFFFPSRNEACPNVIYEALSCGLPVIYHPSGGTPEIASRYGVEFSDDLIETLDKVANNYDSFIEGIKRDYFLFSIDYAGKRYFEVFQKVFIDRI